MVRVLAVADETSESVHSARVRDLRPDIIVSAGDLPWDYLERLVDDFGVPAAFVPGNHEPPGAAPRGMIDLDGRVGSVGGLRIAGLGGCVHYNGGTHQYTQEEYADRAGQMLAAQSEPVALLLTHAPPFGLGDEPEDPAHIGIAALHDLIEALRPRWHLHGHIHPYGMQKPDRRLGATTIRNVIPWSIVDVDPEEGTN